MEQYHFRDICLASPTSSNPFPMVNEDALSRAARLIVDAQYVVAFTGAGISVESGLYIVISLA